MIKHIVLWTLKAEAGGRTAEENALEVKSRLEALVGQVPGLLSVEVGIDIGRTDASADIALVSELTDRVALAGYRVHPAHVEAARFISGVRDQRIVVDYEV